MPRENEPDNPTSSARTAASDFGRVPDRPNLDGIEQRWATVWEENGTYRFDRSKDRCEVFSIDTPPPTVSGSLHVGHVFSYTQTDIVARFQRMNGKAVFYPMGWDDNGLPTERHVQNHFGVRCDPSVAYDDSFVPPSAQVKEPIAISRPNFVELCHQLTAEDEQAFEALFRQLGLSVDWTQTYTTISRDSQRISQRALLRLLGSGHVYRQEAPTLWDVDFQSAVAQAELEDREIAGAYHRVRFMSASGDPIDIETTRPELLPACVALVAHPDDERYAHLFGSMATTPLFGVQVPVHPHGLADPTKGSGIAMVCTFGDLTDVIWWRELGLETRTIVGKNGRLEPVVFGTLGWESKDPERATRNYEHLEGLTMRAAQRRIVELLEESGELIGEPRKITHPVKFYERGERPLEIVSSRQWYVATMALSSELLAAGNALSWHPEFMQQRYDSWVEGLTGDWNISRQRYFGVPFPIWYPIGDDGTVKDNTPILPDENRLPIDPSVDTPPGYEAHQRGEPGGFIGDQDVMDTWATSSLTPQIAGRWCEDDDLFSRIFPMNLRPQAHEIIRTWLFTTVVRSELEHHQLPWSDVAISGWILDPDRKKMSKSKGNVVVPTDLLLTHSTDAVRYWAASARLGADTVFDEQQMKIGRRLAIKILNASKFVLGRLAETREDLTADGVVVDTPLDAAMLSLLSDVVTGATADLVEFEHARALERIERFFWMFCDDYLELVKGRAYGDGQGSASAQRALGLSLNVLLRLFAPFVPFVAEEVWSWYHEESIHTSSWPTPDEVQRARSIDTNGDVLTVVSTALGEIRRAKTEHKLSMRAVADDVVISARRSLLDAITLGRQDLIDAGRIERLQLTEAESDLVVTASFSEAPA